MPPFSAGSRFGSRGNVREHDREPMPASPAIRTPSAAPRPSGPSPTWKPVLLAFVACLFIGCGPAPGGGASPPLIVTQVPTSGSPRPSDADILDLRYPHGTRLLYVRQPSAPNPRSVVISSGFSAAGDPVMAPDGHHVLFVGRRSPSDRWQICWLDLRGGGPRVLTDVPGGAMSPVWLSDDQFAFASPVPRAEWTAAQPVPAVYTRAIDGGVPRRLTHGTEPVTDLTRLQDGRLLVVADLPPRHSTDESSSSAMFVMRADGTECLPLTSGHDHPSALRRPRECPDGRIVFLAAGAGAPVVDARAEQVTLHRSSGTRSVVFPQFSGVCRSIEPLDEGGFVVTLRDVGTLPESRSFGVYRLRAAWAPGTPPVFDDPAWHEVEAVSARRSRMSESSVAAPLDGPARSVVLLGGLFRPSPQTPRRGPSLAGDSARCQLWNSDSTPGPNPP